MKVIQMTLDENLVKGVDKAVKKLKTTRSAFTREALHTALYQLKIKELEWKHRKGYLHYPVDKNEFKIREEEQAWGNE